MEKNIDVTEIMQGLESALKSGLSEKKLTIDGISALIGKTLDKTKEKLMEDVGKYVSDNVCESEMEECLRCKGHIKKQKNPATDND